MSNQLVFGQNIKISITKILTFLIMQKVSNQYQILRIEKKVVSFHFSRYARKCSKFTTDHKSMAAVRQTNSIV